MSQVSDIKNFYERVALQNEPDQWGIHILQGPYKGVVYKYGKVSIDKKRKLILGSERSTIKYEYDILFVPEKLRGKELSEEEETHFHNFLGDVLVSLLHEYYEHKSSNPEKLVLDSVQSVTKKEL